MIQQRVTVTWNRRLLVVLAVVNCFPACRLSLFVCCFEYITNRQQ